MQLVDEQDDAPLGLFDLGQHSLQPLLKLAAVLCARDERAHIQRENGLVLQAFGHVARDDPLRQPLGDRRFADARLTDEHGVVFRFAGQDADDVSDLLVTPDHRVHFLRAGAGNEVRAVLFQRLVGILRRVGRHALIAAHALQRLQTGFLRDAVVREQFFQRRVCRFDQRQQQMLDGNIIVVHLVRHALRAGQARVHGARNVIFIRLAPRAGHARELIELLLHGSVQALHRHAHLAQELRHKPAVLPQKRGEQMHLLDLLVLVFDRQRLRGLHRAKRFLRIFLSVHKSASFI